MQQNEDHVFSVAELNACVSDLLEGTFASVQVTGELHEIRRPASGHWYFVLKDESDQLSCVMFRGDNQRVSQDLHQGDQVKVLGRLNIYRPRGQYQFVARQLEAAGEGLLLKRFEELRKQLTAEGLFDDQRKQPMPERIRRLAMVTSAGADAAQDVLSVAGRRAPLLHITLIPTLVQGDAAPAGICRALDLCEGFSEQAQQPFDAVLLCRGGGSLEDLWAFNEEAVVRRVANLKIPCISGIGHQADFTLTDFAADLRAPTPSAAAEILSEMQSRWPASLTDRTEQLHRAASQHLAGKTQQLSLLQERLSSPSRQLEQWAQRTDEMSERLQQSIHRSRGEYSRKLANTQRLLLGYLRSGTLQRNAARQLQAATEALVHQGSRLQQGRTARVAELAATLRALSPLSVLQRGYAIVRDRAGRVRTDAAGMQVGEQLSAQLANDNLRLRLESVEPDQ